ncbi:MAG: hypothetical protein QXD42_05100 [Nitrososphaerales archaeon]
MAESSEYIAYSVAAEEPRVKGNKYLLIFTNLRLIAAFESGGLTRLATAGIARTAYDDAKIQYMKGKTIEELLSDKRSFFIPYNEINNIEFEAVSKKVLLSNINYLLMKVNSATGSLKEFMIPRTKPEKLDEVEKYLRPILQERLSIKRHGGPEPPSPPR